MSFKEAGGSETFQVTTNESWTINSNSTWVTVSPSSGSESGSVKVTVSANSEFDARVAELTVTTRSLSASVTVNQAAADRVLSVISGNVSVPEAGGTFSVNLQYNVDYDVKVEDAAAGWISFVQTKAVSTGKLEFSIKANTSEDSRIGKVTVSDKAGKAGAQTITFKQDGHNYDRDALVKKNEYTIVAHWGILNPYGDELMVQLKALYEKYHSKGLEIVAFNSWDGEKVSESEVRQYLKDHGYDVFKNVNLFATRVQSYPSVSPAVDVYDKKGHLIFSWITELKKDDIFNHTAIFATGRFIRTISVTSTLSMCQPTSPRMVRWRLCRRLPRVMVSTS